MFIARTILVGLWPLLAARLSGREGRKLLPRPFLRMSSTLLAGLTAAFGVYLLASWQLATTYLGPELVRAAAPKVIQLSFGADILWHYRSHIALTLIPAAACLSIVDALAMPADAWTGSPRQSSGILLGSVRPA